MPTYNLAAAPVSPAESANSDKNAQVADCQVIRESSDIDQALCFPQLGGEQ